MNSFKEGQEDNGQALNQNILQKISQLFQLNECLSIQNFQLIQNQELYQNKKQLNQQLQQQNFQICLKIHSQISFGANINQQICDLEKQLCNLEKQLQKLSSQQTSQQNKNRTNIMQVKCKKDNSHDRKLSSQKYVKTSQPHQIHKVKHQGFKAIARRQKIKQINYQKLKIFQGQKNKIQDLKQIIQQLQTKNKTIQAEFQQLYRQNHEISNGSFQRAQIYDQKNITRTKRYQKSQHNFPKRHSFVDNNQRKRKLSFSQLRRHIR